MTENWGSNQELINNQKTTGIPPWIPAPPADVWHGDHGLTFTLIRSINMDELKDAAIRGVWHHDLGGTESWTNTGYNRPKVLIDVRPKEVVEATGTIPGAATVPLSELDTFLEKLQACVKSKRAAQEEKWKRDYETAQGKITRSTMGFGSGAAANSFAASERGIPDAYLTSRDIRENELPRPAGSTNAIGFTAPVKTTEAPVATPKSEEEEELKFDTHGFVPPRNFPQVREINWTSHELIFIGEGSIVPERHLNRRKLYTQQKAFREANANASSSSKGRTTDTGKNEEELTHGQEDAEAMKKRAVDYIAKYNDNIRRSQKIRDTFQAMNEKEAERKKKQLEALQPPAPTPLPPDYQQATNIATARGFRALADFEGGWMTYALNPVEKGDIEAFLKREQDRATQYNDKEVLEEMSEIEAALDELASTTKSYHPTLTRAPATAPPAEDEEAEEEEEEEAQDANEILDDTTTTGRENIMTLPPTMTFAGVSAAESGATATSIPTASPGGDGGGGPKPGTALAGDQFDAKKAANDAGEAVALAESSFTGGGSNQNHQRQINNANYFNTDKARTSFMSSSSSIRRSQAGRTALSSVSMASGTMNSVAVSLALLLVVPVAMAAVLIVRRQQQHQKIEEKRRRRRK